MKRSGAGQWVVAVAVVILLLAACNDSHPDMAQAAGMQVATRTATSNDTSPATGSSPATTLPGNSTTTASPSGMAATVAPGETGATKSEPTTADPASADTSAGPRLYARGNCAMCHSQQLEGGKLGPALANLSAHGWDMAKLQTFLTNPKDRSVNPERLAELDKQFSMSMPAFTGTSEERAQLAAWLLTK